MISVCESCLRVIRPLGAEFEAPVDWGFIRLGATDTFALVHIKCWHENGGGRMAWIESR